MVTHDKQDIKELWKTLKQKVGDIRYTDYVSFSVSGHDKGGYFSAKVSDDDDDVIEIYPAFKQTPSCKISMRPPMKVKYKDFKVVADLYISYLRRDNGIREIMHTDIFVTTYVIGLIHHFELIKETTIE